MKYLILGAGPTGLSVANYLLRQGVKDILVLEKEKEAGGLCRSINVYGYPLDIGGGHFLDVRRKKVNDFLFSFMPEEEWNLYERDSRIEIDGQEIGHPFEANIWQMSEEKQVEYLKSIAAAGCNTGLEMPDSFIPWIYWKLGTRIAEDYMIPYNQKMFGNELNNLGTYWLDKLPNVSFDDTLLSCLHKKPFGKQPGHAQFYYPKKYGYGELWRRMSIALENKILYEKQVESIDFDNKIVATTDGEKYKADVIITSIPWMELKMIYGMPVEMKKRIQELKYSSVQIEYINDNLNTKAQWIYFPDPNKTYHRILVRSNFCPNSRGYWTETNLDRVENVDVNEFCFVNKYAYPLNTINKPEIMNEILNWSAARNVYGVGRWGEHQHYNSDVSVDLAMKLADRLIGKN